MREREEKQFRVTRYFIYFSQYYDNTQQRIPYVAVSFCVKRKMCLNDDDDETKENDMSSLFSISLSVITRRVVYFRASEYCTFHHAHTSSSSHIDDLGKEKTEEEERREKPNDDASVPVYQQYTHSRVLFFRSL